LQGTEIFSTKSEYDLVIVGGGSAGLFGASRVAELMPKGKNVLLIEKTKSIGNKLCLSGNGQCNFTNACEMKEFKKHYGGKGSFLKFALKHMSNRDIVKSFKKMGLETQTRDDLKVFPKSLKADDVKRILLDYSKKYPVQIKENSMLRSIEYHHDKIMLDISFNEITQKMSTKYLILCTGGLSYPQTGSEGDIVRLLEKFDIKIHPFIPALAVPRLACVIDNKEYPYDLCYLSGINLPNAKLSISKKTPKNLFTKNEPKIKSNAKVMMPSGSLLFTHKGLSGPLILDNSRYFEEGDNIKVYLTKFCNTHDFEKNLLELIDKYPKRKMGNIFTHLGIPERIVEHIMQDEYINIKAAELSKYHRKSIIQKLLYMEFCIIGFDSIDNAMCSRGGVDLSEINKNNMMLKKLPNIFVAGECIDIDGDTGGYNIHSAFATVNLIIKYIADQMSE